MLLIYFFRELRDAFLRNDYEKQTKIAEILLPFEESGMFSNDLIMEIVS